MSLIIVPTDTLEVSVGPKLDGPLVSRLASIGGGADEIILEILAKFEGISPS